MLDPDWKMSAFVFTGTGSPEHAAREATTRLAAFLRTHSWKTHDGRTLYRIQSHFEAAPGGIGGWGTYYIHAFGPEEETA